MRGKVITSYGAGKPNGKANDGINLHPVPEGTASEGGRGQASSTISGNEQEELHGNLISDSALERLRHHRLCPRQ